MFAASIMVCSLVAGNPTFKDDECVIFDDTYGPYHTELQCKERVDQMVVAVSGLFLPRIRCFTVVKERLVYNEPITTIRT